MKLILLIFRYYDLARTIFFSIALHGPVTYMDKSQRNEFVSVVNSVDVDDGGDCDEMAISGIYEIYGNGIKMESPIYVLTDAGAKDAAEENLDALKAMVDTFGTPINFFLSNVGKDYFHDSWLK